MIPISLELNAYLVFIRIAILFSLIYIPVIVVYLKYLSKYHGNSEKCLVELLLPISSLLLASYLETFVYDLF